MQRNLRELFEAGFFLLVAGGIVFRLEILHSHNSRLYPMPPPGKMVMQVSETGRFCHGQTTAIIFRYSPSFDTVLSVSSELLDVKVTDGS